MPVMALSGRAGTGSDRTSGGWAACDPRRRTADECGLRAAAASELLVAGGKFWRGSTVYVKQN